MLAFTFTALLIFASARSADAAPEHCECRMGAVDWDSIDIEGFYGRVIKNYGRLASYESWQPNMIVNCESYCRSLCGRDIKNGTLICNKIGENFNNLIISQRIYCYSVFGREFDGIVQGVVTRLHYSQIKGCKKTCSCPVPALYDVTRRSCVKAAGCATVPGMPNGDKGGGYFATAGKLYKNVPGAVCRVSVIPGNLPSP